MTSNEPRNEAPCIEVVGSERQAQARLNDQSESNSHGRKNMAKKNCIKTWKKRRYKRMGNTKIRAVLGTLLAVAALIALRATFPSGTLPKVHAQEDHLEGCSAETLNGKYGLTFSGFSTNGAVPAPINAFVPVAGVGLMTFDGNGNLSASETVSLGGQIMSVNLPGTYTVDSDCTGSLTTANANLNLVIVRNGREILAINTQEGRVAVDNFIKQ
jgi:hypothetical protein